MNPVDKLKRLKAVYSHAARTVKDEKANLTTALTELKTCLASQKLLQQVAEEVQKRAHDQIAGIVTRCLRAVYGPDTMGFEIAFEQKRGKTSAVPRFVDKAGNKVDPMDGSAGGEVDVVAFALRVAAVVMTRPHRRRLLVLDEPFRYVSREYVPRLAELLQKLVEDLNFQLVVVTHNEKLEVGKVVRL